MAKSMIRNVSPAAITLPPPYTGIIPPGVAVIVDEPPAIVVATLYVIPETQNLLTVDEVSDANPTTLPVSRQTAADTIATVTFAALTAPLDFNGQRAINAGDPIAGQDLVTLSYFDTHGGGGSAVPAGQVPAPGAPQPAIAAGVPVAIVGGVVVPADAANSAAAPCVGLYSGADTHRIRVAGLQTGYPVGTFPSNANIFLAIGGGFTNVAPSGPGNTPQFLGRSVGTTALFFTTQTLVVS